MGTWAAGPFGNDIALDYVGEFVNTLMAPVYDFMASPQVDENFDPAFAAIALLNEVMTRTPVVPYNRVTNAPEDAAPIVAAMITCFDEQIDDLMPDADYKRDQRTALVAELDRFTELLSN